MKALIKKIKRLIYNLLYSKVYFNKNFHLESATVKTKQISDRSGTLEVYLKGGRLENCSFVNNGKNCKLIIGDKVYIKDTTFWFEGEGSIIKIGDETTIESALIAALEGKKVIIGDDCMLSNNVILRTGDSHPIYDSDSQRINLGEDIILGNHVWIGEGCVLLKRSEFPDGSILGTKSLANKKYTDRNCAYAGMPAKIVKPEVYWKRVEG